MTSTSTTREARETVAPSWMILTAVALVAVNLRTLISSLPTVASNIVDITGWSSATIGMLTTIPVLCMGLFALTVPALAMHFGRKYLIIFALISLTMAALLRAIQALPELLFLSAFLAGVGIAFAAGLIPGIVREQLPHSIGRGTSMWTAAQAGGAVLGGAFTVPLAIWIGSWSLALALWAVPAIIALAFWMFVEQKASVHDRPTVIVRLRELPWRSRIAWAIALNIALNSIIYYSSIAWIVPSYEARGWTQETAGWLFGLFTASQVMSAFLLAGLAARMKYRRALFAVAIGLTAISLFAIAWTPNFAAWLMLLTFGFFLSGGFAMTVGLLSEYSADSASAARLTAMVFFITYTLAAVGPLISGLLFDSFDSWSLVFTVLGATALLQLFTVIPLRRGVYVD